MYEGSSDPVIFDINLDVYPGEFVIVGGPNGAGKTTLLETIAGILPVVSGKGTVCGHSIQHEGNLIRKKTGYVLQSFDFDPFSLFTVEDVLMMSRFGLLGWFRLPGKNDKRAVDMGLNTLEIEDLRNKYIGKLSGGQQQKVLIAHNIAKEPEVLLLDEPFSNLDLETREQVCSILKNLCNRGMTIVLVSHAFDVLPEGHVRAVVMKDGKIVFNETMISKYVKDTIRHKSETALR